MKSTLAAAALALAALPAAAERESFSIDPNHTFPAYEIGHFGYSFQRGRFDKTSGKVTLDAAAKTGTVYVTMDPASVDTGVPKLDEHLKNEDFFDVAKFPEIIFKSNDLAFDGDKLTAARGDLTMHGVTKPIEFKVEYFRCAPHPMLKKKVCGADLSARIRRSDFGMSKFIPVLSDEVLLRVNVEAMQD